MAGIGLCADRNQDKRRHKQSLVKPRVWCSSLVIARLASTLRSQQFALVACYATLATAGTFSAPSIPLP